YVPSSNPATTEREDFYLYDSPAIFYPAWGSFFGYYYQGVVLQVHKPQVSNVWSVVLNDSPDDNFFHLTPDPSRNLICANHVGTNCLLHEVTVAIPTEGDIAGASGVPYFGFNL